MINTNNNLPLNSRVWVYQSDREFTLQETEEIQNLMKEFISSWASHGTQLNAAGEVMYNRFIVLFVDESVKDATGCSIDKSVAFIKALEQQFQTNLMNRLNLAYRENGEIKTLKMNEFQNKIQNGELNENVIVFNNLVQSKQEFINNWEVPAHQSWHKNLFLVKH